MTATYIQTTYGENQKILGGEYVLDSYAEQYKANLVKLAQQLRWKKELQFANLLKPVEVDEKEGNRVIYVVTEEGKKAMYIKG